MIGDSVLGPGEVARLEEMTDGASMDCGAILEYLGSVISHGVSEGRFTEKEAHHDLQVALWVAYACNNMDDYEHYYTAVEWLSGVEDLASGCGVWFYRYANALMYCGRPGLALEYCERGIREDPDYPWTWLTLGRLRSHFGDLRGAVQAAERGLELVPGDHEFLTLMSDLENGLTLEQMEMHFIDAESDEELNRLGADSPEYRSKMLAISGIVCDRANLDLIKRSMCVRGWSADHPYCTFLMDRCGSSIMVTFMMNEAMLSKKDLGAVTNIFDSLDRMDSQAREYLSESTDVSNMALYGISIGPYLSVTLSYAVHGRDDITTVDFDPGLDLVERMVGGPFAAILLMRDGEWDSGLVLRNLRDEWGIVLDSAEATDDSVFGMVGDSVVAVSMIRTRVPGEEAEENAANNYLWPGAVEAAKDHRAHIVVALVNHSADPIESGLLFTKIVESCCMIPGILGVYHCGTVFEPSSYVNAAQAMKAGDIPLEDMVWFGMYRVQEGINAYTVGMTAFGRDEMEVVGAGDPPAKVAAFLYDVAYHVLFTGAVFHDGDTIGFEEGQSLKVRRGPGVSVDGTSLIIEYPVKVRFDYRSDI